MTRSAYALAIARLAARVLDLAHGAPWEPRHVQSALCLRSPLDEPGGAVWVLVHSSLPIGPQAKCLLWKLGAYVERGGAWKHVRAWRGLRPWAERALAHDVLAALGGAGEEVRT